MFLSGELFQKLCDYNIDDRYPQRPWDPVTLKEGQRLFLKNCDIPAFLQRPPPKKLNLVIHNSDNTFNDDQYTLLEPYAINVFAENCSAKRGVQIPLGFRDDQYTKHSVLTDVLKDTSVPSEKTILCLVNFMLKNNEADRQKALDYFQTKPWATVQAQYIHWDAGKALDNDHPETKQKRIDYYKTLKQTKFVISPKGAGVDCHRVYEALFFGAVPIVLTSFLDPMYQKLGGVMIVKDWSEITEESLQKAWAARTPPRLQTDPNVWLQTPS